MKPRERDAWIADRFLPRFDKELAWEMIAIAIGMKPVSMKTTKKTPTRTPVGGKRRAWTPSAKAPAPSKMNRSGFLRRESDRVPQNRPPRRMPIDPTLAARLMSSGELFRFLR